MNERTMIFAAMGLVIALCSGCGSSQTCDTSDDCFGGETCSPRGVCVAQDAEDGDTNNNGANNGTSANNGGANNGSGNNGSANNGTTSNNGANNGTSSNNGTTSNNGATNNSTNNGSSNNATSECLPDPFDVSCPSDGNDEFGDYIQMEGRGCESNDDVVVPGEASVTGLICALEVRDKYSVNLIPCDTRNFLVETTLTPQQACDPQLIDFNVSIQGRSCKNPDDNIRCEVLDDGSIRVRAFVLPSISIASLQIDIGKAEGQDDLHFDYDLHIAVRE